MNLENWLAKNEIETGELARIIGVSRQVIWKIKNGMTVDTETANKIRFVTGGCINPPSRPRGRQKIQSKNDV